jgi:hypothetical protein
VFSRIGGINNAVSGAGDEGLLLSFDMVTGDISLGSNDFLIGDIFGESAFSTITSGLLTTSHYYSPSLSTVVIYNILVFLKSLIV